MLVWSEVPWRWRPQLTCCGSKQTGEGPKKQVGGSLEGSWNFCLSQGQVKNVCRDHRQLFCTGFEHTPRYSFGVSCQLGAHFAQDGKDLCYGECERQITERSTLNFTSLFLWSTLQQRWLSLSGGTMLGVCMLCHTLGITRELKLTSTFNLQPFLACKIPPPQVGLPVSRPESYISGSEQQALFIQGFWLGNVFIVLIAVTLSSQLLT